MHLSVGGTGIKTTPPAWSASSSVSRLAFIIVALGTTNDFAPGAEPNLVFITRPHDNHFHTNPFSFSCNAALIFRQELNLSSGFVGPKMVAKESRHVGEQNMKINFHFSFAMTQLTAQRIANKFNQRVWQRLATLYPPDGMPRVWDISFLPCSVYTFLDGGDERSVLVEKKLVGRYTKFNGNNGYLNEAAVAAAANADKAAGSLDGAKNQVEVTGMIEEGDDEDSDGDGASCISGGDDERGTPTIAGSDPSCEVSGRGARASTLPSFIPEPESYVQAFSHFSYRYTRRKMLVCDLQGVQSTSNVGEDRAGVFELTDPVIHYRSKRRRQVYGRTDLGKKGVHRFFETHRCNDVCRLLGLSS